ncbi:MAG: hypothetical protein ACOC1K_06730 [Nanoarchaeota archaeon]
MIDIDYSGADISYNTNILKEKIRKIKKEEKPVFVKDKPPIKKIKQLASKYSKYKNIIVIGNGGSITSSQAFYTALGNMKKKMYVLNTMEPDYVNKLKKNCKKKDTLVIPISKSGNTVGVIESVMAFIDYPMLVVTQTENSALYKIAKKRKIETLEHPVVGGRYSGRTTCGLLPAAILDIDIEAINKGALFMYKKCDTSVSIEKNPALKISTILYALDKKGYHEVFLPIYSTRLEGFNNLIIQLIHESSCKEGKGQTIIGALAPESQHHTNQRFFGGKKNILGLFNRVIDQDDTKSVTKIPKDLADIEIRDGKLEDINNIPLNKSIEFEFLGTKHDASNNRIPNMVISIDKITPHSIGEYLALWQYIAVYSSYLREVNPFDQPQVENSKEISFELRKKYHQL